MISRRCCESHMRFYPIHPRSVAQLAALPGLPLRGACAGDRDPSTVEPSFYRSLAQKDAQVDAASAASMISGYRVNNGLTPARVDPELMKLAQAQDEPMHSRANLTPKY